MFKLLRNNIKINQIILIIFSAIFVIGVSASGLISLSNYSPVIFGSVILIVAIIVIFLRKPAWAVYTALILVLLPIGLLPSTTQSNLNRFLTIITLIIWGISIIRHHWPIAWTMPGFIMVVFLVWCLLTIFWTQDLNLAKDALGGYVLRFILFLFLIPNVINTRNAFDGLMHALAIAGWVFIVIGLISLITHGFEVGTRFRILEGNENTLGGLFPVVMVGVFWLALRNNNPRKTLWVLLSLAFLVLSFLLIALSGSRGSAISWIITILVLLIWRKTRSLGIVGLLILSVASVSAPFILSTTISRFLDNTHDTLLGGREALWEAAWMLIREHPIAGVGIGNSKYVMVSYVILFRSVGGTDLVAIHNPLLTIWADTGLPGLILYLGVLISSGWIFVRHYISRGNFGMQWLTPYFSLTAAAFCGYFITWIKGGGIECSFSYFLMLALLLIPSHLQTQQT